MIMRILVDSHFFKSNYENKGNDVKVVEREGFEWY